MSIYLDNKALIGILFHQYIADVNGMQKTTIIIAVLLVVSSLSIGLIIGLLYNQALNPNNPIPTSNTPSPTSSAKVVSIAYDELSRTVVGSNTRVVLSLSATLISGGSVTIDYSRFALSAFVVRGGTLPSNIGMRYTEVNPQYTGTVTVDSNNPTSTFQLTFEFASEGKNFDDYLRPFSYYELGYSSYYDNPINVQWANQ